MSYPAFKKKRRSQLTKPMGFYKELFDELRLNKDLYKRCKEDSINQNKPKSLHGPVRTIIISMLSIYCVPGDVFSIYIFSFSLIPQENMIK
jgi:hypothetical protein